MSARARRTASMAVPAVIVAILGCGEPTQPSTQPRLQPNDISFDALFVVDEALSSSWLSAGDTIAVRLSVEPSEPSTSAGRVEGTFRYAGVPIWYAAPSDSASFAASYFTVEHLEDHLVGVFWGEQVAGTRLVLILDPERLSMQWAVTTNSGGALIELARGTGAHR